MPKWWFALPHHSHRSCACPRIAAEQEQVELCSQVLNVLCYCLIDFKLCLLGNTPLRTCYIRLEMFFPNAALCLVNPLCAAGSFKGLCLKLELQQCLTPPPQPAMPPCPHSPHWDGAVTHAVFSSKSPPCAVMKSQVFSCCPSPQRLAWERKWSLYYVYVSDLSMPFQKYLHFWSWCLVDFYIYVFQISGAVVLQDHYWVGKSIAGLLLGWRRHPS